MAVERECVNLEAGQFAHDGGCGGAFDGERAGRGGFVGEDGVVHDDVLVERGEGLLAQEGVSKDQHTVFERQGFEFCENVSLGVEQQADGALAGGEIANVAGEHGVQIADAIRSGERKYGAKIGVDQGGVVARLAVFGGEIGKLVREADAEIGSEGCARGDVDIGKRSFEFHRF